MKGNEMNELEKLELMCEALNYEATEGQQEYIAAWVTHNVPMADWGSAANIAAMNGLGNVITDITMRMGESGL